MLSSASIPATVWGQAHEPPQRQADIQADPDPDTGEEPERAPNPPGTIPHPVLPGVDPRQTPGIDQ